MLVKVTILAARYARRLEGALIQSFCGYHPVANDQNTGTWTSPNVDSSIPDDLRGQILHKKVIRHLALHLRVHTLHLRSTATGPPAPPKAVQQ